MRIIDEQKFKEITNKFSSLSPLIVIGDIGIDKYTVGEVKRISPEAPVPVLEVKKEWEKLGLAANISHNLLKLGIKSTLCGVVGDDKRANDFEHLLEETGLNTWGIVRDPGRPTIYKERLTTESQQICRIDYEDTMMINEVVGNQLLERISGFSDDHGAVILEDYAKGTLSQVLIGKIIEKCKSENRLVAVDPGKTTPPSWYKGATLLKPNLAEAKLMVEFLGHTYQKLSVEEMANILVDKLALEKLVITLGSEGMALLDTKADGKLVTIPTVAEEVYDVSGAGDTSITLLTSCLMAGSTLEEAAWIGNCGAGVVVAKKGTATVNLEELSSFYYKLLERYR